MKRVAPVFGVVALITLLVFVNLSINKTAHPDNDDDVPPSSQQTSQAKPAPPPTSTPSIDLPSEITVGDPAKAKYKITVGWVYDEANQANLKTLSDALKAVQKAAQNSGGAASAEIVNLDVPSGDLSPAAGAVAYMGVVINGQMVTASNAGEAGATAADLTSALQKRLSQK